MKEKIKNTKEKATTWWTNNKDKVVKLGLAGGVLYMAGYIHATNKVMNHDRVLVEDNQKDSDIEVIDL